MKSLVFLSTLSVEILLGGSLILTLIFPRNRIWPPPGRSSWQFYFTWGLTALAFLGAIILAFLDWNQFLFKHWTRFPLGIGLLTFGLTMIVWGMKTLGLQTTLGLEGHFVRMGPYRFSRNPQYVGYIALLAGFAILSNSLYVIVASIVGILWFGLAPFTEEPWLKERFGEKYDQYLSEVPRFL